MASSAELLQQAVQAARAGHKEEARDLLLDLVDVDPQNEMAWMWLTGLVDSLEDRIIACENVLTINPANEKVRAYLTELQRQYETVQNNAAAADLLSQAKVLVERKNRDTALQLAMQAVEKRDDCEEAWLLIGKLSPDVDQRIAALKKAYRLNPLNTEIVSALKEAQQLKANPLSAAERLEQLGRFDEALLAYKELAGKAKSSWDFDYIYKQINRIEGLQQEKIRYVAPTSTILRLTFGWPLLYLSLALVQMGLNPFAHFSPLSCLGLPLVLLGGFLLSLGEVHSEHAIWRKLLSELGTGAAVARFLAVVTGWFLILIPHILLLLDSLNRLRNFQIPPMPF